MSRAREAREMERGTETLLTVLAHPCTLKCLSNFPKAQFDKQGDGDGREFVIATSFNYLGNFNTARQDK